MKVTLIDLNDCQAGNCLPMKFSLSCPDLLGSQARPAPCPRARACVHAGPSGSRRLWPRMALACERLHRRDPRALVKNYPFSPELRGFAPSHEPVISARPAHLAPNASACWTIQPALITSQQVRTTRPTGGHEQQPEPERCKSAAIRPAGAAISSKPQL
jgi:hypothetical protein